MAAIVEAVSTADDGSTPNTSGSFTPVIGDLLVSIVAAAACAENPAAITNSAGITFAQVELAGRNTNVNFIYMFVANELVTADTDIAQTITFNPTDTATATVIAAYRISGMTKTGLLAVRQVAKQENQNNTSPATVTFAGASLTTNPLLGTVYATVLPAIDPPSGWTELSENQTTAPAGGVEMCHRNSGHTSDTVTWGTGLNPTGAYCAIVAEFDASSPAGAAPLGSAYYNMLRAS